MAATPQYGTLILVGMRTGQTYSKDIYISDVANAALRWDDGAGAGSGTSTEWTAPEPVVLVDASIVTGTADTEKLQLTRNGVPTGDMIRYSVHLTSLNNRPKLRLRFQALDRISALQVAD